MAETTKRRNPAVPFGRPDPGPLPIEPGEVQIRIRCRGKSAARALDDVRRGLSDAEARSRDPLLVFEDLGLLEDSVATLLKGLCRLLVGYPRTVTFWESSGYSEAFLSVMEGPLSP